MAGRLGSEGTNAPVASASVISNEELTELYLSEDTSKQEFIRALSDKIAFERVDEVFEVKNLDDEINRNQLVGRLAEKVKAKLEGLSNAEYDELCEGFSQPKAIKEQLTKVSAFCLPDEISSWYNNHSKEIKNCNNALKKIKMRQNPPELKTPEDIAEFNESMISAVISNALSTMPIERRRVLYLDDVAGKNYLKNAHDTIARKLFPENRAYGWDYYENILETSNADIREIIDNPGKELKAELTEKLQSKIAIAEETDASQRMREVDMEFLFKRGSAGELYEATLTRIMAEERVGHILGKDVKKEDRDAIQKRLEHALQRTLTDKFTFQLSYEKFLGASSPDEDVSQRLSKGFAVLFENYSKFPDDNIKAYFDDRMPGVNRVLEDFRTRAPEDFDRIHERESVIAQLRRSFCHELTRRIVEALPEKDKNYLKVDYVAILSIYFNVESKYFPEKEKAHDREFYSELLNKDTRTLLREVKLPDALTWGTESAEKHEEPAEKHEEPAEKHEEPAKKPEEAQSEKDKEKPAAGKQDAKAEKEVIPDFLDDYVLKNESKTLAGFAERLKKAKTSTNSSEYKAVISTITELTAGPEPWDPKELKANDNYAAKLIIIKARIDAYLNHKANDGVKKNVYGKLAVIEELNEFVCDRINEISPDKYPNAKVEKAYKSFPKNNQGFLDEKVEFKYTGDKAIEAIEENVELAKPVSETTAKECQSALKCMDRIISRAHESKKQSLEKIQETFFNYPGKESYDIGKVAFSALDKGLSGIHMNKPQVKQIKNLMETGDKAKEFQFAESYQFAFRYAQTHNMKVSIRDASNCFDEYSWGEAESLINDRVKHLSDCKGTINESYGKSSLWYGFNDIRSDVINELQKDTVLEKNKKLASARYSDKELIKKWPEIASELACYEKIIGKDYRSDDVNKIIGDFNKLQTRMCKLSKPQYDKIKNAQAENEQPHNVKQKSEQKSKGL